MHMDMACACTYCVRTAHYSLRNSPCTHSPRKSTYSRPHVLCTQAGLSADLASRAHSTGALSQMTARPDGSCLKQSLYFVWDLEVDCWLGVGLGLATDPKPEPEPEPKPEPKLEPEP